MQQKHEKQDNKENKDENKQSSTAICRVHISTIKIEINSLVISQQQLH